ncbi:recombinase family protein [Bacillus thuringiensis]|uniref:recombinase family protein n=1 Tax=Bacillus thuringiensis TaxID=1428 RepID=UPI002224F44F|nr:recombinase family protein [Bacillus thuringiensis]UYX52375.1 recombinase family protein [Bacillus thuringiensis]
MQRKIVGYVRVSSKDQNEERQIENMKHLGIKDWDIFIDKQSGKNIKRENYQMLKRLARTGDTIVFDSLTRLGRSMNDVLEEFRYYEQQRINLQFIKEPFINLNYSGESTNDVIQQAVQKATLTILSAFAEKEWNDIKQRQAEGIALAKKQGKPLGRPPVQITEQFIEAYEAWQSGKITAVGAMRKYDIKRSSFYKLVKEYEAHEKTKHLAKNE